MAFGILHAMLGSLSKRVHSGLVTRWATLGEGQAFVIGIIGAFGVCTGCKKITPITQA